MQPPRGARVRVGRDDSSQGAYYNPVVIIFGLIALCLVIMAPMLWMLWQMRNSNRHHDVERLDLRTSSPPASSRSPSPQEHAPAQYPRDCEAAAGQRDSQDLQTASIHRKRTPSLASRLRGTVDSSHEAVVTHARSFWQKTQAYFARVTAPRGRRHRRSNTGLSIDLPIMRRAAWQKLASGCITPSPTVSAFAGAERERGAHASAPGAGGTQHAEEGLLARPEPALTVGLAIG